LLQKWHPFSTKSTIKLLLRLCKRARIDCSADDGRVSGGSTAKAGFIASPVISWRNVKDAVAICRKRDVVICNKQWLKKAG